MARGNRRPITINKRRAKRERKNERDKLEKISEYYAKWKPTIENKETEPERMEHFTKWDQAYKTRRDRDLELASFDKISDQIYTKDIWYKYTEYKLNKVFKIKRRGGCEDMFAYTKPVLPGRGDPEGAGEKAAEKDFKAVIEQVNKAAKELRKSLGRQERAPQGQKFREFRKWYEDTQGRKIFDEE